MRCVRRCLLFTALPLGFGCAGELTAPEVVGDWGGPHLHLILQDSGGTLEYDCAHGSIASGWTLSDGIIDGAGEHVQEHGGPVREGEVLPSRPAAYRGHVRGDFMTLTVTLTDSAQVLGTFELQRGRAGLLRRCL